MKRPATIVSLVLLLSVSLSLTAAPLHKLLSRKTDSGATVVGYKDTPPLPSTGGNAASLWVVLGFLVLLVGAAVLGMRERMLPPR